MWLVDIVDEWTVNQKCKRYFILDNLLYSIRCPQLNVNPFRLGILACYLDPLDLGPFLDGSAVSLTLWLQLTQCMTKGLISDSGRVSLAFSNAFPVPSFISCNVWWSVLKRVPLTAVLLVDTSLWEPEHQQHGRCTAVGLQCCADPLRGFPVGFPPITTAAGTANTTRTAPIFPSAGE